MLSTKRDWKWDKTFVMENTAKVNAEKHTASRKQENDKQQEQRKNAQINLKEKIRVPFVGGNLILVVIIAKQMSTINAFQNLLNDTLPIQKMIIYY